jgi:hypothetical protein
MRTIAPGRAALADLRSKITAADYAIMVRMIDGSQPLARARLIAAVAMGPRRRIRRLGG